jgi:uncharacterized membrane protein
MRKITKRLGIAILFGLLIVTSIFYYNNRDLSKHINVISIQEDAYRAGRMNAIKAENMCKGKINTKKFVHISDSIMKYDFETFK